MNKGKTKIKRSKKGCFTCRKRRKACDQVRPICSGCKRNLLPCEWPQYENQTLRDFNFRKAQTEANHDKQDSSDHDASMLIGNVPAPPAPSVGPSHIISPPHISAGGPSIASHPHVGHTPPHIVHTPPGIVPTPPNVPTPPLGSLPPHISPLNQAPPIHQHYQPVVLPQQPNYPPMMQEFSDFKFSTSLLDNFYNDNRNSVQKILMLRNTSLENYLAQENFLDIVFGRIIRLMVPQKLQEKLSRHLLGLIASSDAILKSAICLGSSYILGSDETPHNKRVSDKNYQDALIELKQILKSTDEDQVDMIALNAIGILTIREQNLGLGIQEVLKHLRALYFLINKRISKDTDLNQFSFLLVNDSFIYHYATNLLFYSSQQIDELPDPFLLEKEYNIVYGCNTVKTEVTNPVLSTSYDSFMAASQASYLYRKTGNPEKRLRLAKILLMTIRKILIHSQDLTPCAKLRYHATNIILHRIIDPEVSHKSVTIQQEVNAIIRCIPNTELDAFLLLTSWPLFICGLCCCKYEDRDMIKVLIHGNANDGFTNNERTIINFLEHVWSEDIGLNIIDEIETLGSVSLM